MIVFLFGLVSGGKKWAVFSRQFDSWQFTEGSRQFDGLQYDTQNEFNANIELCLQILHVLAVKAE